MTGTTPRVNGVVLAGGRSTRFRGENKAIATMEGTTLLERVASTLAAATDRRPIVAVRTEEQRRTYRDRLSTPAEFVFDAPGFEGPLAGLFAAFDVVETQWAFVCGCDMPLLSKSAIRWLATRLPPIDASKDPPDALTVAHPDGTIEPLHALYRSTAVKETRERLSSNDGPRSLLESLENIRVETLDNAPLYAPLGRSTTNVNTRQELSAIVHHTEPNNE